MWNLKIKGQGMRILFISFNIIISIIFAACSFSNTGIGEKELISRGHSIGVVDGGFDASKLDSTRVSIDASLASDTSYASLKHGTDVTNIILEYNINTAVYAYSASSHSSGKYLSPHTAMFKRAYDKGARIFNNSYGYIDSIYDSSIPSDMYKEQIYTASYLELARMASKDSIFVWAAGNESKKYASYASHVPLVTNKIGNNIVEPQTWSNAKRGWISVVSISEYGKFDDSYSNWIGEDAKNWGIAAIGTYKGNYMLGNTIQGTSFAAPRVSAAVANVWDKFPWMNNHLVTQTILSTADKYTIQDTQSDYKGTVGDMWLSGIVTTGPNKKVGWGVLNEQRALKGPARFDTRLLVDSDNGQVQVNFENRNYPLESITWSNNIAGDAGLNKSGSGTLYLSGSNTYSGNTTINGGNLIVGNAILNSNITIESRGALTTQNLNGNMMTITLGSGNFTLLNNGSFNVVNKTIINGNYNGIADSKILFDITNSNLEVNGSVNIGNGKVVAYAGSIPQAKTVTRELIKANGGITNWDNSYSSASAYLNIEDMNLSNNTLEVSYNRNSTQSLMKSQGYSDNHILELSNRVDEALDSASLANTDSSMYQEALALVNTNMTALPSAIKSLSGEIYDSSMNILLKQNDMFNRAYARRIYGILMSEDDGVYAEVLHGRSKISQENFASGKITLNGVIAGYDKRFDNVSLGFAGYFGDSKGEFNIAGSSHLQSFGGSIYFGAKLDTLYILSRVGAGLSLIKANRSLAFGEALQIEGESSYKTLNVYTEMGLKLGNDNFNIVPFIAAEWDKFWREKIDEIGSSMSLDIAKQESDTSSLLGGVKLELGSSFKVNGLFFHKKLLSKANMSSNAIYSGIATNGFTLRGINQSDNLTFAGAGVKYDIDGFSMFVDYLVSFKDLFSKAALEDSMISAGFRIGF